VPTVINGLPAHVLLIHVVIVLIPLGALFTVLSALWPAARRKLGFISPLTCLIALLFVPITTNAGHWLKNHEHFTGALGARVDKHAALAANFVWYAVGLFVISAVVWWLGRKYDMTLRPNSGRTEASPQTNGSGAGGGTATATRTQTQTSEQVLPQWVTVVVAVAAVFMSALIVWQLYRIGDAGAHAVWQGSV
jgi:hypothetical protein